MLSAVPADSGHGDHLGELVAAVRPEFCGEVDADGVRPGDQLGVPVGTVGDAAVLHGAARVVDEASREGVFVGVDPDDSHGSWAFLSLGWLWQTGPVVRTHALMSPRPRRSYQATSQGRHRRGGTHHAMPPPGRRGSGISSHPRRCCRPRS